MNNNIQKLQEILGSVCKEHVMLAPYTTLKVGGPADLFFEARTKEQFLQAIQSARELDVPVTILGGGTNILVSDKGIRGLVIKNLTNGINVKGIKGKYEHGNQISTVFVEVDSGVIFNSLVRFTVEEGYQGIEMHLGLPGTVGGAVYMNSKWTNPVGYVGDVVSEARLINSEGELITVPRSYFSFAYDYSNLQKTKDILISVVFAFTTASKESLWERANQSIAYRRASQPQGVFSPGCTFQNISQADALTIPTPLHTTSAGYLIDHAGLKGYTIGKAQVSPVHANFIINLGGATAHDIVLLIQHIQKTVYETFRVHLKEELVYLGEF